MDSLTHIVLGAAIGDRILGKSIGRKAAFFGALAKTVPDFDLFISGLTDARKYILYHRSYTHSFFVEAVMVFPLAWLCHRFFKEKTTLRQWVFLWGACLIGHSVVDMFTNYGTRLFLPFSTNLISLNNIAIADLFLTIPITVLVVIGLIKANDSKARRRLMVATLVYAVAYFDMTFINKAIAQHHFRKGIASKKIRVMRSMSNPTMLNNFLWYCVINDSRKSYTATYSLFQGDKPLEWRVYPIDAILQRDIQSYDVPTMIWFSQGFYICRKRGDTLLYYVTKFGPQNLDADSLDERYLMYYRVYRDDTTWRLNMKQPTKETFQPKKALLQLGQHILPQVSN